MARQLAAQVRVASYNVLSSHLAEPGYFTKCEPRFLEPGYRLQKLQVKLEGEIAQRAVICLQEVSITWVGTLHVYFGKRGYTLVPALYGNRNNGYMGVALAFPNDVYEADEVVVTVVSETKARWPRRPTPSSTQLVGAAAWSVASLAFWPFTQSLRLLGFGKRPVWQREGDKSTDAYSSWEYAASRSNRLVLARLTHKLSGRRFCVATYHMPCAFWDSAVMHIHCALAAQFVQKTAAADAYVLAGDFNIKPRDSTYELLTKGRVPNEHHGLPKRVDPSDSWAPVLEEPMRSAYAVANGKEPDFTNYAQTKSMAEPFIEVDVALPRRIRCF